MIIVAEIEEKQRMIFVKRGKLEYIKKVDRIEQINFFDYYLLLFMYCT